MRKMNPKIFTFILFFLIVPFICLERVSSEEDELNNSCELKFNFENTITLVKSPSDSNTFRKTDKQYLNLTHLLGFPKVLESKIVAILKDEKLRKQDPNALIRAAEIAGAYHMEDCAPVLVNLITLNGIYIDEIDDGRVVFDGSNPEARREHFDSITDVLIKIGKPSIEHVLKLAGSEKATKLELEKAGLVLQGVEGDLTYYVVENYIKKSVNPEETRKLMEREPFRNYWQKEK